MERLDSTCNKKWKSYSYVEKCVEIILFVVLEKMDKFINILNQTWISYTDWINFFLHTNELWTTIIGVAILVWLFSFLIFLPLHRRSLRKVLKAKQNLTDEVDEVIYLLSKAQYFLSEKQTLQYDPCFALMKTMFESGHFEYIDNLDTIKENVKKVEVLLKQRIISDDQWNKIDKQKRNLKIATFWSKLFGYELNLATIGIYNLFW